MERALAKELIKKVLPSYEVEEKIGEGSFGAVFKMRDSLKERAVKIIPLTASRSLENGSITSVTVKIERDFKHIIESYERIECDEIVTIYDFYKVSAGGDERQEKAYAIVIMELYPSNLHDYVIDNYGNLSIEKVAFLMEKLASILDILYSKRNFLFEDLKPENLLVKESGGELKLVIGDIGGLKNIGSVSTAGSQVTLNYCAPEVIRKGQQPDLRSIIYSYGLLSYFILEGRLPYEKYDAAERMDLLKNIGLVFGRSNIPQNLKAVIEKCLLFEPEDRYKDFNEIIKAIREEKKFADETIDLSSFKIGAPPSPAEAGKEPDRRPFPPFDRRGMPIPTAAPAEPKKKVEAIQLSDEKNIIEKIDKEIRGLVIKSGETYKLNDEHYKVYGDIKIERGGVLAIENTRLYFDENSGVVALGALRAKNSVFGAIDFSMGWKNIVVNPTDAGLGHIEECKLIFGKGRTWKELKNICINVTLISNEQYTYGGGLFIAGVRDKKFAVKDSIFYRCSALEGGGIYSFKSDIIIEKCEFNACTAGMKGGAINCLESNPVIRNCMFSRCSADKGGGGLFCTTSNPSIDDSIFDMCTTTYLYGGGICCFGSSPSVKSCKFNRCTAAKDGGGIYCDNKSSPRIIQTFYTNCRPNNTNYGQVPTTPKGRDGFFYR